MSILLPLQFLPDILFPDEIVKVAKLLTCFEVKGGLPPGLLASSPLSIYCAKAICGHHYPAREKTVSLRQPDCGTFISL
jgi:hypothetical protein